MKILFITDNFFPESNAPANRTYDHARIWQSLGHEVIILTCAPNFPAGKVFEGYQNAWRTVEKIDGITVIRIKTYIAENKGTLKRMLDYASFGLHAALQGLWVRKPDVIIGTSPQPFSVFAARFISLIKRKPFVFELRDIWPESILAVGAMQKKNMLLNLFEKMITRCYHKATVIVTVTDSFKTYLIHEKKVPSNKIAVFKNGVSTAHAPTVSKEILKKQYGIDHPFVVGYIGTLGMAHGIQTLVDAATLLAHANVQMVLMGDGADAAKIEALAKTQKNITFIKAGDRQTAINVLNMCDASIVHLKNTPLFQTVIPSKIFEAMALGKPILMGVKGESRKIVIEDAHAGIAFEPENSESLRDAVLTCQRQVFDSNAIQTFVREHYDREKIATKMIEKIQDAI
jgi:glycosyltransferase involved in cell wall biosynthesis